jgi:hypothetical protein
MTTIIYLTIIINNLRGQSHKKMCESMTWDVSFDLFANSFLTINVPLFLEVRDFMFFPIKKHKNSKLLKSVVHWYFYVPVNRAYISGRQTPV